MFLAWEIELGVQKNCEGWRVEDCDLRKMGDEDWKEGSLILESKDDCGHASVSTSILGTVFIPPGPLSPKNQRKVQKKKRKAWDDVRTCSQWETRPQAGQARMGSTNLFGQERGPNNSQEDPRNLRSVMG